MKSQAVRLAEVDPDDAQQVFWFAEPKAFEVLAMPIPDVTLWRRRLDIKHINYVCLTRTITNDDRYARFRQLIQDAGLTLHTGLGVLITAAYELVYAHMHPGMFRPGANIVDAICATWSAPPAERFDIAKAVQCCELSGFFKKVDWNACREFYPDIKDRASEASGDEEGVKPKRRGKRVRARTRRERGAAVDTTRSESTGSDLFNTSDRPRAEGETGPDRATVSPTDRPTGLRHQMPNGQWIDAQNKPEQGYELIVKWVKSLPRVADATPYPSNAQDWHDLQAAYCKCLELNDLQPLYETIQEAVKDAKSGGWFHRLLELRGLITRDTSKGVTHGA